LLIMYPNPTNGLMNIRLDEGTNTKTDIRVLDLSGKTVYIETSVNLHFANHTLNLDELTAGTYVLELTSNHERVVRRINIID
jgi:hypothetical protein